MVDHTLKILENDLQKRAETCGFKFHIVDMREVEGKYGAFDSGFLKVLSNAEIEYLNNLKLDKNKIQWISGRYAVKCALFGYKLASSNIMDLSCVDVMKGSDSAPFIVQYPSIRVSITHSYPYCIAVVSDNKIGIDLERVFEPEQSLVRYFFCTNEADILMNYVGSKDYQIQTMKMWTRKEAISKLFGLGMKMDFKSIDTTKDMICLIEHHDKPIKLLSDICNDFCVSLAIEGDIIARKSRVS